MTKAHSPINWENEPSFNTPINEANLNKMDSTIGILDDRIIAQDTSKLDKSTANTMVKDISFNENNGVFTVTRLNGSTFTIDTRLEKIAINFKYDYSTQKLIVTLIDGTTQSIDMSALLTQYEFEESNQIGWEVTEDGKVKAKILDGSITEDMLQPNYLAEIKVETEKSAQSMANAKTSENNAKQSELNAKASEEQALEYSNNAQPLAQSVSGNNPTASNSTDGSVIYLNNSGYTEQNTLSGKNKLKMTAPTKTANGITITNNGDQSFSAKGTASSDTNITIGDYTLLQDLFKSGFTGVLSLTNATYDNSTCNITLVYTLSGSTSVKYMLPNSIQTIPPDSTIVNANFYIHNGTTVDLSNVKVQLELGDAVTEWEPYCGGTASPNPEYPQRIGASADKGYFDGELVQGYIGSSGTITTDSHAVTSKNIIPCSEEDTIVINYEETVINLAIVTYNNGTYVGTIDGANVSSNSYTIPSGVDGFKFFIYDGNGITPSTAKHICVTLNGQYALRVKTSNKNLFAFGKTAIDKTSEIRPNSNQRLAITSVDGSLNTIKCAYKGGNYSMGYVAISGLDITKPYKISYTVKENTTSYTPTIGISTAWTTENNLVLHIDSGNKANNVSSDNYFVLSDIQVEEGTVATPYEPHQESEALIPISAPFYDGDFIEVYADGSGQIYRENYKGLLPKTGWRKNNDVTKWLEIYSSNPVSGIQASSEKLKSTHFGNSNDNSLVYAYHTFYAKFPLSTTEESAIEFLSNTDVEYIVKLAKPTITPLTPEQVAEFLKLQTFKGVTNITADGEVVMRYYCDNASGETVSMLQGMVEETKEAVSKVENLGNAFEVFDVTSASISVSSGQTSTIMLPLSADGYSALGVVGASSDTDGVDIGGVTMDIDRVTAYVKVTNNTSATKSAKVTIQVLYIK